jgi:hypothetical protein
MDVIIVCHTEFGFVSKKNIIFAKDPKENLKKGVLNLVKVAEKYGAKVTFAVCPETAPYFPKDIRCEVGLHIHPGWEKFNSGGLEFFVGDEYLRKNCKQSSSSTVLKDFPYDEQLDMINKGKEFIRGQLGKDPKVFVAGRWSLNSDTTKALVRNGFTHDCSAPAHSKSKHHNWSNLPRICMPYQPSEKDYQEKGSLPILMIPVSQYFPHGNVNPEVVPQVGLSWLKASFSEYYIQNLPLFHICLHSPCMTDEYFISRMDNFLSFISRHKGVNFKFTSEIHQYSRVNPKTKIIPYILGFNKEIIKTFFKNRVIKFKKKYEKYL